MKAVLSQDVDKKRARIAVLETDVVTAERGARDIGETFVRNGAIKFTEISFYGIAELSDKDNLPSYRGRLRGHRYRTDVGGGYFDTHEPYQSANVAFYHDTQTSYMVHTKTRMKDAPAESNSQLVIEISSLNEEEALNIGETLKEFLAKNYSVPFAEEQAT